MYKVLTGDCSSSRSTSEKQIDERITKLAEEAFELDEPDILLDLRKMNGKPNATTFEQFWVELSCYLEEITPAVDDRRHGTSLHMPIAISVSDLRDIISERLHKKFPDEVPDLYHQWNGLDFSFSRAIPTALIVCVTQESLIVKFSVQIRQLRKNHQDSKYMMVLIKYMKELAVRFAQNVVLISVDDKATIPVGELDTPASTGVRGHHRPTSSTMEALDHDFNVFGVIPSVCLVIDVPESPSDLFFTGQVYVCNKNKIIQPSNPFRHSAEISKILINEGCRDKSLSCNKSVLLIISDGGPDHRITNGSVQVALLTLFICLDMDMLIAIHTCPYQSWTNPAERVMSILNIALQNVSLQRSKMDDNSEILTKNASNMHMIRRLIEKHPELQPQIDATLKPVQELLSNRFERMKLRDRNFKSCEVATEAEISNIFDEIKSIDMTILRDHLQQNDLKKAVDFQAFLDSHVQRSHYAFQVRKCLLSSCVYCTAHPVRMPLQQFESMYYLPLPLLDSSGEHFKPFKDVFGQLPSKKDHPSLKLTVGGDETKEFNKAI